MERNWLIRTSQNQILGPVAKGKLLEFIQKGALGLTDEVASGNGYWFSLKEKDLVEKYIYGDIPQSYNPISESKSVLARRDNPEKTSSINTAPANQTQYTQVIKVSEIGGLTPKSEDLEYPDITVVRPKASPAESGDVKIPAADDLEFPDVAAVTSSVSASFSSRPTLNLTPTPPSQAPRPQPVAAVQPAPKVNLEKPSHGNDETLYPSDDDLAFPDLTDFTKTSTKVEKGKVDLSHQYTRTVALDNEQIGSVLPEVLEEKKSPHKPIIELEEESEDLHFSLTLDVPGSSAPPVKEEVIHEEVKTPVIKKEKLQIEDRKLLHDRRPKVNAKAIQRDPTRETAHREREGHPSETNLKKRNDNYIFFVLIILILIIIAVFFYFKEILNKPLPV